MKAPAGSVGGWKDSLEEVEEERFWLATAQKFKSYTFWGGGL